MIMSLWGQQTSVADTTFYCSSDNGWYCDKYKFDWYKTTVYNHISYQQNQAKVHHWSGKTQYRQVSNIRRTLVGNKIVDHSDVDGALPVGAAPTTSSFST